MGEEDEVMERRAALRSLAASWLLRTLLLLLLLLLSAVRDDSLGLPEMLLFDFLPQLESVFGRRCAWRPPVVPDRRLSVVEVLSEELPLSSLAVAVPRIPSSPVRRAGERVSMTRDEG
jgi:hypothetical protein